MNNLNLEQVLVTAFVDKIFSDPDRLHKAALASKRPYTVKDIAYLLGKDPSTIQRWQRGGKIRMNQGPDNHLTMRPEDFDEWYTETYKKPAPKL